MGPYNETIYEAMKSRIGQACLYCPPGTRCFQQVTITGVAELKNFNGEERLVFETEEARLDPADCWFLAQRTDADSKLFDLGAES